MSHHIVETLDLHHTYPDGTEALRGVSFRIHHGESVAIVGANGAGKSTLLLHLNGVLMASAGSVRVGEIPLVKETLKEVRRALGLVFQDPDDQLFMPTVFEDVAFGPLNMGIPVNEVEARVSRTLAEVGASHLAAKPPYRLSSGEKRRVAIASVLALGPDILVLDEPTTGLDPRARRQLIALLREFHHTKIFATHDLDLVLDLCSRTLVLHQGRIAADGPTAEIFADASKLSEWGLELPLSLQGRCGFPPSLKKGDDREASRSNNASIAP
jgi:cobalt/nickel transport system ATP-binding protein